MEKEFIPYEQALALKELGFDEPCFVYWVFNNVEITFSTANNKSGWSMIGFKNNQMVKKAGLCTAPTFSQAFRWFRDKYDLRIWIESKSPILFEYTIATSNAVFLNMVFEDNSFYGTYEEAELECLKKLIEITKNK